MDTEETIPSGKKKFFISSLVAVLTIAGVLGYRYYYNRGGTEPPEASSTLPPEEPTEAEKLLKSQNEEFDKLRAQYRAQSTPQATTTTQSQIKSIDTVRAKQKTTSIPVTPVKKTLEQQIQELDALRAAALNK